MGRTVRILTGKYLPNSTGEVVDFDEVLDWEGWDEPSWSVIRLHMRCGYVRKFLCANQHLGELVEKLEALKSRMPEVEKI